MAASERIQSVAHTITHIVAAASLLMIMASTVAPRASAASVSYIMSPTSGSVQPNSTVEIKLSIKADVAIAGASVHLNATGGTYADFASLASPALSFVDYHTEQNDAVFICSNNRCDPGTYEVATFTVRAGASGTMRVAFEPRETADPDLGTLPADATSGSFAITASAPPAIAPTNKPNQNKITVPKDDGNGGIEPLQITSEQFSEQVSEAQNQSFSGADESIETADSKPFWTFKNIAIGGLGIGISVGLILLIVIKFFIKPPGSGGIGPYTPSGPTGGGTGGIVVG